jgi:crossover junction endodeoxyribonuclease RuvC
VTLRLIIGCDPGQSGCLALLADGEPAGFIDMPTMPRAAGGNEVNAAALAAQLRGLMHKHTGAYLLAVVEQVSAMPGQGVTSMFRFGQSDGVLRGVLGALGVPHIEVHPTKWKNHFGLKGQPKDAARTLAIRRFPAIAEQLARKKDCGRADSLLLALWAANTEAHAKAA